MKRNTLARLLLLALLPVLLLPAVAVADLSAHWALPAARSLESRLGWASPADLDRTISPSEWNRLIARVLDKPAGAVPPEQDLTGYWVWAYTGGMSTGETIARQDAIGGMMKLMNGFFQYPFDYSREQELERFADRKELADHQRSLVAEAVAAGLVGGYPDRTLRPTVPLTNGEALVLAERFWLAVQQHAAPKPYEGIAPPAGFGSGLKPALTFEVDRVISSGAPLSGAGDIYLVLHGAAEVAAIPGVGPAPDGHLWVLVDAEVTSRSEHYTLQAATQLDFALEDGPQLLFRYELNRAAAAALDSPFAAPTATLAPGGSLRGLAVFAVPVGTKGLWHHLQSAVGPAKDPSSPWNGGQRSLLGDLAGPERVWPYGLHDGGLYRVEGIYPTAAEAGKVTARLREMGYTAWIGAEPDGRYAAVVNFRYFER